MRWMAGLGSVQRPRWVSLVVVCSAIIFCSLVTPVLLKALDLLDQYDGYSYLASSLLGYASQTPQGLGVSVVLDKIIVMASLESEDTSWVAEELPEYAERNLALFFAPNHLTNSAVASQLAARHLPRQSLHSDGSLVPRIHDTCQQGSRGYGLSDVHYRSL